MRNSFRWIIGTFALTTLVWIAGLAGLLAGAKYVHDDVPQLLAAKLPLLGSDPKLIFGGDSRTLYQVDPVLAAGLKGWPRGAVVNIAYEAGEPLAFLAAVRRNAVQFKKADLVISIPPFLLNEGIRQAATYPPDVAARFSVLELLTTFLPMRVGTLVRFIREAFNSHLARVQGIAEYGPSPPDYGLIKLPARPDYRWPDEIGSHEYYRRWNIGGPRARYELGALCEMTPLVKGLTVVFPPWSPRYDRTTDRAWRIKDDELVQLITTTGNRCGFSTLPLPSVPGLTREDFFDEAHLNDLGIPIYTRYLLSQLRP